MLANKTRIEVCVATYKRPELLRRLLFSLRQQRLEPDMEMHIIVVDNDATGSACEIVERFASTNTLSVRYEQEPVQNIALARNHALSLCTGDYIAFIDDDEEAKPDWLKHLLSTARKFQAAAVFGPVVSIYPKDTPVWILRGKFFDRARYQTGTQRPHGSTNNVLISRMRLVETKIQFDSAYGRTGGEDTNFFYRFGAAGNLMIWCDEALVTEAVADDRMTPAWLIKRAYRGGQMYGRLLMSPKPLLARAPWVMQRIAYLTISIIALPLAGLLGKDKLVQILMKISSSLGHLTSQFGQFYEGYR